MNNVESLSQLKDEFTSYILDLIFEERIETRYFANLSPNKDPLFQVDMVLYDYYNIGFDLILLNKNCFEKTKLKSLHIDRSFLYKKTQNIRLVQIFENEWVNQNELVKSRIRNILGQSERIFARNCSCVKLTSQEKDRFLNKCHIQKSSPSTINLGLTHKKTHKLVAVMTFGKSRYNNRFEYELIRYSNAFGVSVVGGASKIFKYFCKNYKPKSVVSYCDLRWNTGNLYEKIGFKYSHRSEPNYFYFHPKDLNRLYTRVSFQKHKLHKKLKIFDKKKTEHENMLANGFLRIYDCGNNVYLYS